MQAKSGCNDLELALAYYTLNIPSMQEKKLVSKSLAAYNTDGSLTRVKLGHLFSCRMIFTV